MANLMENKSVTVDQSTLYKTVVNNGSMACRLIQRLSPEVVLELLQDVLEEEADDNLHGDSAESGE